MALNTYEAPAYYQGVPPGTACLACLNALTRAGPDELPILIATKDMLLRGQKVRFLDSSVERRVPL